MQECNPFRLVPHICPQLANVGLNRIITGAGDPAAALSELRGFLCLVPHICPQLANVGFKSNHNRGR